MKKKMQLYQKVITSFFILDKLMCEKGTDFLMKRVEDISDIWHQIEQPRKNLPLILSIKITDEKNSTQGRLILVDLLYPTFSLLLSPTNEKEVLESSCIHLCKYTFFLKKKEEEGFYSTYSKNISR